MKKIVILVLAVICLLCMAGCSDKNNSPDDVYETMFEPSVSLTLSDGCDAQLMEVYTSKRLYPSLHFGSYLESSEDMCYIDVVLRFEAGKNDIYSADIGSIVAVGTDTGNHYTDGVCAVESNGNTDLLTNVKIDAGQSALVHMAVEVPLADADDEYEITLDIMSATYKFLYESGDRISDVTEMKQGQNISNEDYKVKLGRVYYSDELYDGAPNIFVCDEGYVYLISELQITNKSSSDVDFRDVVSVSVMHDNDVFNARYIMKNDDEKVTYSTTGKIDKSESATVLAIIDLPAEFESDDVEVEYAIDMNVFTYVVDGGSYKEQQEKEEAAEEAMKRAREEATKEAAKQDSKLNNKTADTNKTDDSDSADDNNKKNPDDKKDDSKDNIDTSDDKSKDETADKGNNNGDSTSADKTDDKQNGTTIDTEDNVDITTPTEVETNPQQSAGSTSAGSGQDSGGENSASAETQTTSAEGVAAN